MMREQLAPTEAECELIVAAVESKGVVAAVAHVMRYSPYTRLLRRLLSEDAIGEIVSIDHLEPVGFWHQAHSFVRGNWRREDETGPMLLAKCCHDIDWLSYIVGRAPEAVSSFGRLSQFRPEQRPDGAGDRCLQCAIEPDCPYSARKIYVEAAARGDTSWPVDVVAWPPTPENVEAALQEGRYGRCVWACDNDVVDHQVVSLRYAGGVTANLTMTAFTEMRDRVTRIYGTRGELRGDGETIEVYSFLTRETSRHEVGDVTGRHGGGDEAIMGDFIAAVAAGDPALVPTSPRVALESHRIVFAAEVARHEDRVVTFG